MTTRRAACSCGQLHLTIEGEPSRISMCHCLECQRRTGAVISNQARFRREQITFAGEAGAWMRNAESGNALTFLVREVIAEERKGFDVSAAAGDQLGAAAGKEVHGREVLKDPDWIEGREDCDGAAQTDAFRPQSQP
jgi:Glutathione-dependent formaldehyde-activating enzyme